MAGAQASAIISVEILVKQNVILPMRIGLKFLCTSVYRSTARLIAEEYSGQPISNFSGHLEQVHVTAGTGWTLDLEVVSVIQIIGKQRADQQGVHRHPYGAPPVGVPTKHAGIGFCREVIYAIFLGIDVENVGMLGMIAGERSNAIRAKEFILIEHARQDSTQPFRTNQRSDPSSRVPEMARSCWMNALQ